MADGEPTESVPGGKKPRRKVVSPTPLEAGPSLPELRERAKRLLTDAGEKELFATLREDLLVSYLLEVQAGQDTEINPQHSRASRKQAKEIAELLIQLTARGKE